MPKYLLRLRKTSFLLMFRNSAMSLGSNKASSKDEATWHPIPPLKLLIDASSLRGLPLSISFWRLEAKSQLLEADYPRIYPSLRGLGNLLLLCNSLGLVFLSRTRSPSFYYLFSFLLSLPFWISRIGPMWYRWLRRRKRRFGRR